LHVGLGAECCAADETTKEPPIGHNEGQPAGRRAKLAMAGYPLGPVAFFEYIDEWRNGGEFPGLAFT
jgi:hypothetical protein